MLGLSMLAGAARHARRHPRPHRTHGGTEAIATGAKDVRYVNGVVNDCQSIFQKIVEEDDLGIDAYVEFCDSGSPSGEQAMNLDVFSTARLSAERMTAAHLPDLRRLHQNRQVMAYMGGVWDDAQTTTYLTRNLAHWAEHGFGMWILRDVATHQVAGLGGLRHLDVDDVREVELGYAFFPPLWGHGLATELATACVDIARRQLRLPSIVAVTTPANQASQRVMVKAGLTYERAIVLSGEPSVLFRRVLEAEVTAEYAWQPDSVGSPARRLT